VGIPYMLVTLLTSDYYTTSYAYYPQPPPRWEAPPGGYIPAFLLNITVRLLEKPILYKFPQTLNILLNLGTYLHLLRPDAIGTRRPSRSLLLTDLYNSYKISVPTSAGAPLCWYGVGFVTSQNDFTNIEFMNYQGSSYVSTVPTYATPSLNGVQRPSGLDKPFEELGTFTRAYGVEDLLSGDFITRTVLSRTYPTLEANRLRSVWKPYIQSSNYELAAMPDSYWLLYTRREIN